MICSFVKGATLLRFLPFSGEGVGEAVGVIGYNFGQSVHWNPDVLRKFENYKYKATPYGTYPEETMWLGSMDAINAAIRACHFVTVCVVHVALVGRVELHLI
jgi:hypothetical protein